MSGEQTLLARTALSITCALVSILVVRSEKLLSLTKSRFDRLVLWVFAGSRLGIFVFVFFVLHLPPRGDITIYSEEAGFARAGLLPYGGFYSSYAPLHPYLDAALMTIWHSPLVLIFFAISLEYLVVSLWMGISRNFFGEETVRLATLLYATSGVSVQFVTIDGQNNIAISLLLVLALESLWRTREIRSGLAIGFGVAAVKFLPLLYVPVYFLAAQCRRKLILGVAWPVAFVYGTCLFLHLPILQPFVREGYMRSPGDLPYLVEVLTGWSIPSALTSIVLLTVLAAVFFKLVAAIRNASSETRMQIVTFGMAALTMSLVLFAKKSWPAYLILTWFPICLTVASRSFSKIAIFALFNVVAVVEHSYWATVIGQYPSLHTHLQLLMGSSHTEFFLLMQIALLAVYLWILSLTFKQIAGTDLIPKI